MCCSLYGKPFLCLSCQLLNHSCCGNTFCHFRNPSKLVIPKGSGGIDADKPLSDPNLTVFGGDVTKAADVAKVFDAAPIDGVIVALGGKTSEGKSFSLFTCSSFVKNSSIPTNLVDMYCFQYFVSSQTSVGDTMLTDGTNNIIAAMKDKGVKRIAVVTSIGAGDSKDQAPFAFKILMMTVMKKIFNDKNNQEKAVEQSGLEYCIVRPGGLTVDAPTGVINVIDGEAGSIPRADVAQFCLEAVKDEDFPYIGKAPCISSLGGTSWTKDRSKAARGEM